MSPDLVLHQWNLCFWTGHSVASGTWSWGGWPTWILQSGKATSNLCSEEANIPGRWTKGRICIMASWLFLHVLSLVPASPSTETARLLLLGCSLDQQWGVTLKWARNGSLSPTPTYLVTIFILFALVLGMGTWVRCMLTTCSATKLYPRSLESSF